MIRKLYIVGAGSVGGHIALNINSYTRNYEIAGFFDDDSEKIGSKLFGYEVFGPVDKILNLGAVSIVLGIAFPVIKKKIVKVLSENKFLEFPTLIHERAWISNDVTIGDGSVVYPGSSINYGSVIGNFVVINMNCAFGHHTQVGNFSNLAPGVNTGGHTIIEEAVEVGIGAATIQDVNLGSYSVIGGQSMVINNVDPGTTVAGIPAKVINK